MQQNDKKQTISEEQIANRAYKLWVDRGRRNDLDIQNWRDAERGLEYEAYESRKSDQDLLNYLRSPVT